LVAFKKSPFLHAPFLWLRDISVWCFLFIYHARFLRIGCVIRYSM